ncbi:CRISPR system Cascade subunit CasB [Streptomyces sp. DfronAA-171]|nr:CRISPR system Cascade subunit CasB [Streptomyces sp. DfronAA-171]
MVLATRLRELVLLLRREEIPLDYGLLADQLHRWTLPGGAQGVRRSWGRSYLVLARPAAPASAPGEDSSPLDPTTTEDDTP